jgi:hypothetical protein
MSLVFILFFILFYSIQCVHVNAVRPNKQKKLFFQAEKIEGKMKDILERFRRNANRLQAFRESLLSLAQLDVATTPLTTELRLAFTGITTEHTIALASMTSFLEEEMGTMDVDEKLDGILSIIDECKKIGKMNEMRLRDIRGSLTSLVQVDAWTLDISPQGSYCFALLCFVLFCFTKICQTQFNCCRKFFFSLFCPFFY